MIKDIFSFDADKCFDLRNIEDFLGYLVDSNGICKTCGQDHSFGPTYEDVKTSIDVIPELLQEKKVWRLI